MYRVDFGLGGTDWQERIDFARMRRERLARSQAMMKKYGIAAGLLFKGDNMRYVTGVRGVMFFERYALAFAEDDPIVYEIGDTLTHQRRHCTWIKPENWRYSIPLYWGQCGPAAARAQAKKWAAGIVADLRDRGLHKEKLGVDMIDGYRAQALREAGVETVDLNAAMGEARRIKTQDEIDTMKAAIAISNVAFANVCETVRPGLRECDVGGAAIEAVLRAGAESAYVGIHSGGRTHDLYHVANSDKMIELGDLMFAQTCSTTYMGYSTCIYRSFVVGRKPNEKERDWYKKCYERVYSVIEAIKPGATTADAAKHLLPASTWGYEAEDRLYIAEVGHGVGLFVWEEPIISRICSLDYPQTFEPGMVMAVECREGELRYGGVRLEEMVLVTDTGHEVITTWPSEELPRAGTTLY